MDIKVQSPVPKHVQPGPNGKDLREAARGFEGMLWTQIFQTMRSTIQPSGLLGDSGQARSTYDFLLDQAVVQQAVQGTRRMPLAEQLEASWRQREGSGMHLEG